MSDTQSTHDSLYLDRYSGSVRYTVYSWLCSSSWCCHTRKYNNVTGSGDIHTGSRFYIVWTLSRETCLWGFPRDNTKASLLNYRDSVVNCNFAFGKLDMILSNKQITRSLCRLACFFVVGKPWRPVFFHKNTILSLLYTDNKGTDQPTVCSVW